MLKRHEGFRGKPYHCTAGKLTIGYGRNLDDVGITQEEAEILLSKDIQQAIRNAMDIFPALSKYTENRQIALINMVFNLGKTRFLGFVNMIKAIKKDYWMSASVEALDSKWARKDVGNRAIEIAEMLRKG